MGSPFLQILILCHTNYGSRSTDFDEDQLHDLDTCLAQSLRHQIGVNGERTSQAALRILTDTFPAAAIFNFSKLSLFALLVKKGTDGVLDAIHRYRINNRCSTPCGFYHTVHTLLNYDLAELWPNLTWLEGPGTLTQILSLIKRTISEHHWRLDRDAVLKKPAFFKYLLPTHENLTYTKHNLFKILEKTPTRSGIHNILVFWLSHPYPRPCECGETTTDFRLHAFTCPQNTRDVTEFRRKLTPSRKILFDTNLPSFLKGTHCFFFPR